MNTPLESPLSERELSIVRETHLPPEKLYAAWTTPQLMEQWFCPRPWYVTDVEVDVRVGGAFRMTICGPDEERFPNTGVYLEIIPNRKLIFTDAFTADWEPNPQKMFVGILTFEELPGGGTRYTAKARHWTREACENHEAMGFTEGWNKAFDQLVEMYEKQ
jgi:uncharacterized protein YndB with AHSA1/START domain